MIWKLLRPRPISSPATWFCILLYICFRVREFSGSNMVLCGESISSRVRAGAPGMGFRLELAVAAVLP